MHIKNYIKVFEKRFKKRYRKALKKSFINSQCEYGGQGADRELFAAHQQGFTLIEILVVIGIIAVLAAVVLVAINPSRQFKLARDSQRVSNVDSILNAIDQNMAEHGGIFDCGSSTVAFPASSTVIQGLGYGNYYDLAACVVPYYIPALPFDPSVQGAHYTNITDYNTGYLISQDSFGRITITANGEITPVISATR